MSTRDPRRLAYLAVATVIAVGMAAFFIGFYVLPVQNPAATAWERICRAAGVVRPQESGLARAASAAHSSVIMPRAAMVPGTPDQAGRGATLALRCTMCHGAAGVSGADAPNLAGQYSDAIYKQLVDFKRGARTDAVMGAMVATLTDEDMLDLSHYYAGLPHSTDDALDGAPALIRVGDPMRNIAPCASCHGHADGKMGAPLLEGEPLAYLQQQLTAFKQATRQNDINAAMRNEARRLSAKDMATLTEHYAHASH